MTTELCGAQDKLDRAKEHIEEFQRRVRAFFATDPYRQIVEIDPQTRERVTKIKMVKQMPSTVKMIAADAIGNLRIALDQAGYAVAIANGGSGKGGAFPFGDDLADAMNRATGGSKEIHPDIFSLMITFKPYKGGNDALWALNKLSNADKHRMTFAAVSASGGVNYKSVSGSGPLAMPFPVWNREKHEMELFRTGADSKLKYEAQFSMYVAFGEIDIVERQPVEPYLLHMAGQVESILASIDAESARIGLFK
jgi:hypothetical protein